MSDYWEEEYLGINPYQGEIEALVTAIRESIEKEVQEEISQLREENKKLQGIKEHFEDVKRDYERKKSECDRGIANAEYNARVARLNKIMEDHKIIRWTISWVLAYGKKCEKCNNGRYIEIRLPSGRAVEDRCECATVSRKIYYPVPCVLYELEDKHGINAWYQQYSSSDGGRYVLYGDYTIYDNYDNYDNKNVIENLENHKLDEYELGKILFDSKEECQKICDGLNKKQGHPDWIYTMEGKKIVGEENG